MVRAMNLTPQELTAMLSGGGIPGMAAVPADDFNEEQEEAAYEELLNYQPSINYLSLCSMPSAVHLCELRSVGSQHPLLSVSARFTFTSASSVSNGHL